MLKIITRAEGLYTPGGLRLPHLDHPALQFLELFAGTPQNERMRDMTGHHGEGVLRRQSLWQSFALRGAGSLSNSNGGLSQTSYGGAIHGVGKEGWRRRESCPEVSPMLYRQSMTGYSSTLKKEIKEDEEMSEDMMGEELIENEKIENEMEETIKDEVEIAKETSIPSLYAQDKQNRSSILSFTADPVQRQDSTMSLISLESPVDDHQTRKDLFKNCNRPSARDRIKHHDTRIAEIKNFEENRLNEPSEETTVGFVRFEMMTPMLSER